MKQFFIMLKYKLHGILFVLRHREFIILSVARGVGDDSYNVEYTFKMKAEDVVDAMDTVRPFFKECEQLDNTLKIAQGILLQSYQASTN